MAVFLVDEEDRLATWMGWQGWGGENSGGHKAMAPGERRSYGGVSGQVRGIGAGEGAVKMSQGQRSSQVPTEVWGLHRHEGRPESHELT